MLLFIVIVLFLCMRMCPGLPEKQVNADLRCIPGKINKLKLKLTVLSDSFSQWFHIHAVCVCVCVCVRACVCVNSIMRKALEGS